MSIHAGSMDPEAGGVRSDNFERADTIPIPDRRARHAQRVASAFVFALDCVALAAVALLSNVSLLTGLGFGALVVFVLLCSSEYRARITMRTLEEVPRLSGRLAIPLLLAAPVALLADGAHDLLVMALITVPAVLVARTVSYAIVRSARRHHLLMETAVILGAGSVGTELAHIFQTYPEYGIQPVGFLDNVPESDLTLPLLGEVDDLSRVLAKGRVQRVIVAFGPIREAQLVGVLRAAVFHDVEVHVVPRFFDCGVGPDGPDIDDVRGILLYRVRRAALRETAWWVKRTFDVVLSAIALALLAPAIALISFLVHRSSPGPVFFRQRRVGRDGRDIEVIKFRTMRENEDCDTQWSVADDDRVTNVGRILRRTSLDELPQFWSVLIGQLSLVGPRPERPYFVTRFANRIDGYGDRHRVPAGLTGWAQIHGLRGDTSMKERSRLDNYYIEHWSLWRDFVTMVRTVGEIARGARDGEH